MSREAAWRRIPGAVWALGLTSLFMDTSSEAIASILPLFITQILGASPEVLGVLEGVAEGVTAFTKLLSGLLADKLRARKGLTIAGYSLAAASKPFFALANSVAWIAAARVTDRIGKGIRGSPRDALIADLTPRGVEGAAFGLRQALDTVGAFLGPLSALALMAWLGFGPRVVFWLAVIPAALSVTTLVFGVREPARQRKPEDKRWTLRSMGALPAAVWVVCGIGALTTMARFSEAFLILRAQDQGLALALAPLVLITMNIVYAVVAYPAGALSDRVPAHYLLIVGCVVLAVADGLLSGQPGVMRTVAGAAAWGGHMGLTQGVLSAMVGVAAPQQLRGSAFGVFNLVLGVAIIASSSLAGFLWQTLGPSTTFQAGAGFSMAAALATLALSAWLRKRS